MKMKPVVSIAVVLVLLLAGGVSAYLVKRHTEVTQPPQARTNVLVFNNDSATLDIIKSGKFTFNSVNTQQTNPETAPTSATTNMWVSGQFLENKENAQVVKKCLDVQKVAYAEAAGKPYQHYLDVMGIPQQERGIGVSQPGDGRYEGFYMFALQGKYHCSGIFAHQDAQEQGKYEGLFSSIDSIPLMFRLIWRQAACRLTSRIFHKIRLMRLPILLHKNLV